MPCDLFGKLLHAQAKNMPDVVPLGAASPYEIE
jgi:hypothetical protein